MKVPVPGVGGAEAGVGGGGGPATEGKSGKMNAVASVQNATN